LCHLIIHQVRGKLRELIIILSLSAEKFVSWAVQSKADSLD
jgi:hypothetical protein